MLTYDAGQWSENHPDAAKLLNEVAPTQSTVDNFCALFCERFPSKTIDVTPVSFDVELADLRQQSDKSLAAYYKRAVSLMQRIGAKDGPWDSNKVLTQLESAMLDTIIKAFIRGL